MKLLVTSALEETWDSNLNEIVFLGKWCLPYGKEANLKGKVYKIIPFHWDNRDKLLEDYNYLHEIHSIILNNLTNYLNSYHSSNYSLKFWQTILDPWLQNYLSVQFDRWENLRFLFQDSDESFYKIFYPQLTPKTPFDYNDFVEYSISDEFNEFLFNKILIYRYGSRIKFIKSNKKLEENNFHSNLEFKSGTEKINLIYIKKFIINVRYSIIRFLFPKTDIISIETPIRGGFLSRFRLQWKLKKIIFFYLPELNRSFTELFKRNFYTNGSDRNLGILESFNANSEFENFIRYNILEDLPICVVESFDILRNYVYNIPIKPKIILTGWAHWGNTLAKFWFALKQESGTKLIICEHGGSLPAHKELLNFEEDISFLKATWFIPFHPKHIKLPPLKLIGLYDKWNINGTNEIISIIGTETPKYVFRIHFYILSAQFFNYIFNIRLFYENLAPQLQNITLFRPYYDYGWNTKEMLKEFIIDKNILSRKENFENLLLRSKIVVCTYPETTFSEAMAIGVPTILIYNPQFNERNIVSKQIIDLLLEAKIIFYNPIKASDHINEIWDKTSEWWNSIQVQYARNKFLEQGAFPNKNWDSIWANFFKKLLEE